MEDFKYLKDNKNLIIAQKKSAMKKADAVSFIYSATDKSGAEIKSITDTPFEEIGVINVKVVINTTNVLDSHNDCHIPGLWKKTLKESRLLYLLDNHNLCFDDVISDEVKASTQTVTFKELGSNLSGYTEALIFDAIVRAERNEDMFKAYYKGWVKNHSVGMQYVNLFLCINSEEKYYAEEKANWDKYYPMVANKEVADERGCFWAVTEAKLIEGSAVVIGSNHITPTISVSEVPAETTPKSEPFKNTLTKSETEQIIKESFNKIKN